MKAKVTWIVIADGNQAKVFEHDGPGKGLRALKDLQFEQEPLKASDIMSQETLRHHFRRRAGVSPSAYRRAFGREAA